MMPPPPQFRPGGIFIPQNALLARAIPQYAPTYSPAFYWPYPSPPVSPTNYYTSPSVGGLSPMAQQAPLVTLSKIEPANGNPTKYDFIHESAINQGASTYVTLQLAAPECLHMAQLDPRQDIEKSLQMLPLQAANN